METTLFDASGQPRVYIAGDGETIYTWDGHAVAYVTDGKVYGWRGQHRGWLERGVLFDISGHPLGFTKRACPHVTRVEPVKSVRRVKSVKSVRSVPRVKPVFQSSTSQHDLAAYLRT